MQWALEYREKYNMDVFVDLLGYRKYGHNEGDEPKFTQPTLYKQIASHLSLRELYLKQLTAEGNITNEEAETVRINFETHLDASLEKAKSKTSAFVKHFLEETWKDVRFSTPEDFDSTPNTGIAEKKLVELGTKLSTLPKGEKFFRKTEKVFEDRLNMIQNDQLDWAMGELLAYATLLEEGHPVRVSGQDVERGTFSHRHAVVKTDEDAEKEIITLNMLSKNQAPLRIYNSLLSEYGVLGFDYGYAFGTPQGLTIWEAQFGDFNNGAQIMIDQFISAAEDKWGSMNGIVMFLPHGYEGQGSEHSSGRMERFLQLCAEHNMQVCDVTTPANFFHLLRKQVKQPFRKPLIVFTPKKLLRHPKAVSSIKEMSKGSFQMVIEDNSVDKKKVNKVVLCTGKMYYDMAEEREKRGVTDMALIRIEQLYPFPQKALEKAMKGYGKKVQLLWAQEEPENMGAWSYIMRMMRKSNIDVIAYPAQASPAAGSSKMHEARMRQVMEQLFA
jgi:2-oxoglutarate dehydrogenase E1 component